MGQARSGQLEVVVHIVVQNTRRGIEGATKRRQQRLCRKVSALRNCSLGCYTRNTNIGIQRNYKLHFPKPTCKPSASPRGRALVLLPDAGYPAASALPTTTTPRPTAVLQAQGLVKSRY